MMILVVEKVATLANVFVGAAIFDVEIQSERDVQDAINFHQSLSSLPNVTVLVVGLIVIVMYI